MKPFKFSFFIVLMFFVLTSCFESNEDVLPESKYYNADWKINTNPNINEFNTHDSIFLRSHFDTQNFDNPLVYPRPRGALYAIVYENTPENIEDPCYYHKRIFLKSIFLTVNRNNQKESIGLEVINNISYYRRKESGVNPYDRLIIWKSYPTGFSQGLLVFSYTDKTVNQIYASDTIKYTVTGMHKNFSMRTNNNFKLNLKYTDRFTYPVGSINYPEGKIIYIARNIDVFPANNCKE